MPPASHRSGICRCATITLLVAVAAVFGLCIWYWVGHSRFNADEGFYLAAARATLSGDLPYRDYGYTQGPILPLIDAPLLAVFPPTLETFRWICAGWAACGLVVAFFLMGGRRRPLAAALGLVPLASTPIVLPYLCIGKTYSLGQLFLLLAAGALLLPWTARRCLVWLAVFGVLAAGTRLTLAPVVGLLWLGLWWQRRKELTWRWAILVPALVGLAVIGPFFALAPERFVFWNLGFHREVTFSRYSAGAWLAVWAGAPGVWIVLGVALALVWRAWRSDIAGGVMLVAAAGGLGLNLLTVGVSYPEYLTVFVVLLLVGSGRVILAYQRGHRLALPVFGVCVALNCFCARLPSPEDEFQREAPLFGQAQAAAAFLREHTAPGAFVLACNAEIPVAAGRPLFANLVMGKFAVTSEYDEARAERLGLLHFNRLNAAVARAEVAAIVLTASPSWNFSWTVPSMRPAGAAQGEFFKHLSRNYEIRHAGEVYLVLLPRRQPIQ
jgi:hypothetical protein